MEPTDRAKAAEMLSSFDHASAAAARAHSLPIMVLYMGLAGPLALLPTVAATASDATLLVLGALSLLAIAGTLVVYLVTARGWKRRTNRRYAFTFGGMMAVYLVTVSVAVNGGPIWVAPAGGAAIVAIAVAGSLVEWRARS